MPAWIAATRGGGASSRVTSQLVPEFAPLPHALLFDQLGALLALTAAELSGSRIVSTSVTRSMRDQVHDHINSAVQ